MWRGSAATRGSLTLRPHGSTWSNTIVRLPPIVMPQGEARPNTARGEPMDRPWIDANHKATLRDGELDATR
eukprot:2400049-Alexandrium_andersonii.AAC.1